MFIADGGGGGSAKTPPEYSGTQQKLSVDPSAIPEARKVFMDALNRLEPVIRNAMDALEAHPWAGDPVSKETADAFNRDTFERGDSAAFTAILAYRQQLRGVVDQLTAIEADYRRVEGDNVAAWGRINNN
ncbi:transcriptional regulator [Saccharothrix obliqua]|uniref:transcriptional regulator n=1 Tax=Saccharothrix obliqua TaxID=2861747 RepID=UPI001C5FF081|nr:transcriptional regulator [Saccharothrix obliqua]MBW4715699.1 transcriptional regulator [Saccharothrix obliqua]